MNIGLALVNYEVYGEGERLHGTASVDLPDIEFATTDIKGAGIAGSISFPIKGNFDNFTMTYHWRTLTESGAQYLSQQRGVIHSLRGAQEAYDAGTGERKVVPIRIDVRAHANKLALGKFEPGEQVETELEVVLDWIKVTIDGKVVVDVDKFNFRAAINGADYLSDVRAALGY